MSHHSIARLHRHSPPLRSPIEQGQSPSSPAPAAAIPSSLPHETSDAASVHPLERALAMSRRRPRGGAQRMDAAIDHFAPMGYRRADVRSVVNKLLKDVYGKDGWPFLEDSCYYVVQEALLEMQEQQDKLQLQAVQQQQQHEDGDGGDDDDDDEEAQQQEAAMIEPPLENAMPIVMVHSEAPSETLLAVEQTGEVIPMIMDPPAPRTALPHPASTGTSRTRRPCYGWISESESDSDYEEYLARRQKQVHAPAK